MEMSERIKLIRGNLLQDDFAKKVGVSKMTVGRWERGERIPDATDLNNILKAFPDVNPGWLLADEGSMKRGEVARPEMAKEPQPAYSAPLITANYDAELTEIVDILQRDLPETKKFILKVLRGKKDVKEGLEGLGLKVKGEGE